jgi:hypothetical protein
MGRKISAWIPAAFVVIVIFAWAPWITATSAEARAIAAFDRAWKFVADGCGTNCSGFGAVSSQRVPFGVLVTIEYACGLLPADLPEYHRQSTAFVSALNTVHALPAP